MLEVLKNFENKRQQIDPDHWDSLRLPAQVMVATMSMLVENGDVILSRGRTSDHELFGRIEGWSKRSKKVQKPRRYKRML